MSEIKVKNIKTDKILEVFNKQKEYAKIFRNSTRKERIKKLKKLKKAILIHREDIQDAIYADFKRHPTSSGILDVFTNIEEIKIAIKNLSRWMNKTRVGSSIFLIGSSSWTKYEPRGVSLIIAPWNLPVNLSIGPLVSAIAAGNTAIIKPSEFTPHVSKVIFKIVSAVFEEHEVHVVEGDWRLGDYLTELPFDFIYFTGSTKVGKKIAEKAGKNLIPYTIELGGKTPVIVDKSANLSLSVGRIITAKFLNNGQICLAPDYALVHKSILTDFVEECKKALVKSYGEDPQKSPSYCRLVTEGQVLKMQSLLEDALFQGGEVLVGGKIDVEAKYLSPTMIIGMSPESKIMQEEIFGPILPILTFENTSQIIDFINQKERPLSLYLFSRSKRQINQISKNTISGSMIINHAGLNYLNSNLPFGGVKSSGIGRAHGFAGFKSFSSERSYLRQYLFLSASEILKPPFNRIKKRVLDFFIKFG